MSRSGWKLLRDAHEIQVLATAKTVDAKWGALLKRNLRKYDKAAIRVPSYMKKLEQARQEKEELDKRLAANENLLDARAHRLQHSWSYVKHDFRRYFPPGTKIQVAFATHEGSL